MVLDKLRKIYNKSLCTGDIPEEWRLANVTAVFNNSSAVAEMGDRGHNRHWPKRWGAAVPDSRRAGTPSDTMWPGPRSIPYQVASSSIQPFGHNRHRPKLVGVGVPFFAGSWVPIEHSRLG